MKLSLQKIAVIAMTGLTSVASVVPAQAQDVTLSFGQRQRVIQTYCQRYPNDYDCRSYSGGNWRQRDYDRFYYSNRRNLDPLAAGIFGLALGAIIGGAVSNGNGPSYGDRVIGRVDNSHAARCYARFRSYDERSDTYLGYDGNRHYCNL